jgi:hypothetical protein
MSKTQNNGGKNKESCVLEGDAVVVNLTWEVAADMDLAALCVDDKSGEALLVYYGMRGSRCGRPFVHLSIDHDGGGRRKLRREHLVVSDIEAHDAIYLFAWDHDGIVGTHDDDTMTGTNDWRVTVTDRHNQKYEVNGAFSTENNLRLVGALLGKRFQAMDSKAYVRRASDLVPTLRSLVNLNVEIAA